MSAISKWLLNAEKLHTNCPLSTAFNLIYIYIYIYYRPIWLLWLECVGDNMKEGRLGPKGGLLFIENAPWC